MKQLFLLLLFCVLLISNPFLTFAQPNEMDNPDVPYRDSGEGYGVNPGTSKKTSDEIFQDLMNIFFGSRPKDRSTGSPDSNNSPSPNPTNVNSSPIPSIRQPSQVQPSLISTIPPETNTGDTILADTRQIQGCPPGNSKHHLAGTRYLHLKQQFNCNPPRMFVIHWSASWSSAQATFNVLNDRDRSCQIAIDDTETLQMLDFYTNEVQHGWCVGGEHNTGSISYEITGAYFDDVLKNPSSGNYARLMKMTDTAVALTCRLTAKYNIPKTAVYGHYELNSGKQDPGPQYLQFFKSRVLNEC